jgi:hypothetical protein
MQAPELVWDPRSQSQYGLLADSDIGYRNLDTPCAVTSSSDPWTYLESLTVDIPLRSLPREYPVLQFRARTVVFPRLTNSHGRITSSRSSTASARFAVPSPLTTQTSSVPLTSSCSSRMPPRAARTSSRTRTHYIQGDHLSGSCSS